MSHLFQSVETHQGDLAWGRFLDAGTGWASLKWCLSLKTDSLTAVTGSKSRLAALQQDAGPQLRRGDRLLLGNWVEPRFLDQEQFDTVLVDYLVGALDRFAPYYQTRIFDRLRPLVRRRLYCIGLEPYREPNPEEEDGKLLQSLVSLRDASLLLKGDRPHREFPRWWVVEQLQASGFRIMKEETFPILYGERFVKAELDVCRSCLTDIPKELQQSVRDYEATLRRRLLTRVKEKPLRWGSDYLIVAEPVSR